MAFDIHRLIDRVTSAVDRLAYLTPYAHTADAVPDPRPVLGEVSRRMEVPGFDADALRIFVRQAERERRIDPVLALSALHVIACHPDVRAWDEAAALAGEQEVAALALGGPRLDANLASVDRHRGVLAFLLCHYDVALEHFARALERERSAQNLANVLCALLRLGEEAEARSLLRLATASFPPEVASEVSAFVASDPDLALLRNG